MESGVPAKYVGVTKRGVCFACVCVLVLSKAARRAYRLHREGDTQQHAYINTNTIICTGSYESRDTPEELKYETWRRLPFGERPPAREGHALQGRDCEGLTGFRARPRSRRGCPRRPRASGAPTATAPSVTRRPPWRDGDGWLLSTAMSCGTPGGAANLTRAAWHSRERERERERERARERERVLSLCNSVLC